MIKGVGGVLLRYKELTEKEQEDFDSFTTTIHKPRDKKDDIYGLCSSCKHFNLVKSEFKVMKSNCDQHKDINITIGEPIKYCSCYSKIGEMSLYEMGQLALFISLDKDKERAGF